MLRTAILVLALALGPAASVRAQDPAAGAEQAGPAPESREILVMLRMPPAHFRPNARYAGRYDDHAAQAARQRLAAGIAKDNGLELVDGWPMPLIGVDCYVMRVPEGRSLESAIEQVSRHRMVAWSQPLHSYEALAAPERPDDPLFPVQPAAEEWRLAELHGLATGRGTTIAIIDSKIETGHPDLSGQFAASRDFLANGPAAAESHGTGVAGIIAAKADNGMGVAGIAPDARLMALRACSERPRGGGEAAACDSLTLAKALHFALEHRADVINMSLSGPADPLLASLIALGLQKRVAVVAAFDARRADGGFPASLPGVISVAEESLPSVPARVYRAPGRDVPTTQPGGRWYLVNGSSFAAAHVSGLLALLREERGAAPRAANLARTSSGVVDACATLVEVSRDCDCSCSIGRTLAARRD
ncbi:MAG TPA: S8 family serine peptidase [Croceibacterium sp.]|nr:S8 family serine peptidase [Croceibacterium sp.]